MSQKKELWENVVHFWNHLFGSSVSPRSLIVPVWPTLWSSFCISSVTGHICQPVSGGRYVLCLQHWRLQVSGWHDSAYPTQPEIPLCILYCSHQQETTFCLHLFSKGEPRHVMKTWDEQEVGEINWRTEEECVKSYL